MQQALMDYDPRRFLDNLNAVLMDGWTIVPGSWGCGSVDQVPGPAVPAKYVFPNGRAIQRYFFCCVEEPRVRAHVTTPEGSTDARGYD